MNELVGLGATHFYTVPGESFLEVLEAVRVNREAKLVSTRHESGASFMAEAHAKLTGRPAVAMATRAPGAANLSIGVHTAWHDSTPLIALIGQVDASFIGSGLAFQEIDLEAFYRPFTKATVTLRHADGVGQLARWTYKLATIGRPGPVAVALPADVLSGTPQPEPPRPLVEPVVAQGEPTLEILELARRLADADRPVMIVGGRTAGLWTELIELVNHYQIGVYSAFRRQDHFPNDHPCYLGHLTLAPTPSLLTPLRDADLVLALGCRLSEVTTQHFTLPLSQAFFAHLDGDAGAKTIGPGRRPDIAVSVDPRVGVAALLRSRKTLSRPRQWLEAHCAYEQDSFPPAVSTEPLLQPSEVVAVMQEELPEDAIVANDAGNFSIPLHRYWRFRHPYTQLAPTSGAMGYAVPAAVAAGLLRPGRTVVAVAGDGGYLMTGQEVETAVRLGVKIIVVVMRNGLYGTIAMHQARLFGEIAGVEIGDVDLARHASSLGGQGISVGDRESLRDALRQALVASGPTVLDVRVDPEAVTPSSRLAGLKAEGRRARG